MVLRGETDVEFVLAVHKSLHRKIFKDEFSSSFAKPFAQAGLSEKNQQPVGHRFNFTGADQKTRLTVQADFIRAVEVICQHGPARSEGLRQRA